MSLNDDEHDYILQKLCQIKRYMTDFSIAQSRWLVAIISDPFDLSAVYTQFPYAKFRGST